MNKFIARAATALLLCTAAPAAAQLDGTESIARGVPFEAIVMQGGAMLIDVEVGIRFTLYGSDGLAAWSEEWSDLGSRSCEASDCRATVRDGRLNAVLGSYAALDETLLDIDEYEVGYEIYDGSEWVGISTRVPLSPARHAIWATSSGAFSTAAPTVRGATSVSGTIEFGRLEVTGGYGVEAGTYAEAGAFDVANALTVASVEVTGAADLQGSTVRVGEGLRIGGAAGPVVFAPGTSDSTVRLGAGDGTTYQFGGNVEISNTLQSDPVHVGEGVVMDAAYLEAGAPLRADWIEVGSDGAENTGISTSTWFCWVGGWDFGGGTACSGPTSACRTSSSGSCDGSANSCGSSGAGACVNGACTYMPTFEVYVTPNTSQWQVQVDFAGEATTNVDVGVVCSRIRASNFVCEPDELLGDSEFLNPSCTGYADDPVNYNSTEWFAATADYFPSSWRSRFGAAP